MQTTSGQADAAVEPPRPRGLLAPLRVAVYRRFWFASLLSSLGLLIQGVGAAWEMTRLTGAADMVAAVQSALMLPIMLVAIPAGALADMIDKRKAFLAGVSLSLASATMLVVVTLGGMLSPHVLLAFCFLVGAGNALYGPAWQSSSAEQVPAEDLPQAIALNSISYNIARSIGPAIGGLIMATAGAIGAFGANALLYLPLLATLLLWRRQVATPRLPPERIIGAISAGLRYIGNSPPLRTVMARNFINGVAGSSLVALMPLVAKNLLGGGARTYGLLLGAFGVGAVIGAMMLPRLRRRLSSDRIMRGAVLAMSAAILLVGLNLAAAVSGIALVVAGASWMIMAAVCSIVVQLSSPRWLAGRSVAAYLASLSGGNAIGSFIWGQVAAPEGVAATLLISAMTLAATLLLARMWPIPSPPTSEPSLLELADFDVAMSLTPRSGPIVIEVEYSVSAEEARAFYRTMQRLQQARRRIGAYGWSISRDIADPDIWVERYHLPTWLDYLRHRSRVTQAEGELIAAAKAFHTGPEPVRARRLLERPFGSVRWRDEVPDPGLAGAVPTIVAGGQ